MSRWIVEQHVGVLRHIAHRGAFVVIPSFQPQSQFGHAHKRATQISVEYRAVLKKEKKVFQKIFFPKRPRALQNMYSTIISQPMGFQLFNHWFLTPHVFNHSTIYFYPHMCSMIGSQPYLTHPR